MDGILIIDKPENFTSHDVVARLRRILKTKRVGHTGTLDPFATGVLIMLVGKATRLAQFLDKDAKEYEATIRFGSETDTGDRTGELRITNDELRKFSTDELEDVLKDFRGEIWQTPPMYSAKKMAGKKLYELARKGIEVEREPVKISIYELEIIKPPELKKSPSIEPQIIDEKSESENRKFENLESEIKVVCSAGTYIRTLAEDIGRKLETGAHLAELRRTRAGKFDLSRAVTLEDLEKIAAENRLRDVFISMNEAVSHLPEIVLTETQIKDIQNGKKLRVAAMKFADSQIVRMIDAAENLIAIGRYSENESFVQPKLVLL